jgi:hypothetical protein
MCFQGVDRAVIFFEMKKEAQPTHLCQCRANASPLIAAVRPAWQAFNR